MHTTVFSIDTTMRHILEAVHTTVSSTQIKKILWRFGSYAPWHCFIRLRRCFPFALAPVTFNNITIGSIYTHGLFFFFFWNTPFQYYFLSVTFAEAVLTAPLVAWQRYYSVLKSSLVHLYESRLYRLHYRGHINGPLVWHSSSVLGSTSWKQSFHHSFKLTF